MATSSTLFTRVSAAGALPMLLGGALAADMLAREARRGQRPAGDDHVQKIADIEWFSHSLRARMGTGVYPCSQ